ncbi:hypothetical protein, partial [Klebsiella pneumoniae]|uniref:hypothetical protein n=1 Tax=Klebsiella pneumoniae TaxID=573 RepID=UPI001C8F9941
FVIINNAVLNILLELVIVEILNEQDGTTICRSNKCVEILINRQTGRSRVRNLPISKITTNVIISTKKPS